MKHNLRICIASGPETGGIVRCKTVRLRERVLRRLFGDMMLWRKSPRSAAAFP